MTSRGTNPRHSRRRILVGLAALAVVPLVVTQIRAADARQRTPECLADLGVW